MKKLIMIMTLCASITNTYSNEKDSAAIKSIIESVGLFADLHQFEALEKLYTPEVELDYTSLSGGEVELKSPQAIMTQWAGVLPGFDLTRHELSEIQVSLNERTATAKAKVAANHWLGELFWQVEGNYVYRLIKDGDQWLINYHQFNLDSEKGSREIFTPAIKKLKQTLRITSNVSKQNQPF